MTELAQLGSDISRAYANGALGEDDHQRLWEAIQTRREAARPELPPASKGPPRIPARRSQRSPDRQASIERRRRMVGTIAMPSALASRFTWGEQAVHRVIGNEVKKHGVCDLHIDAIAARAGVCRSTVQNALREAQGRGEIPGTPIISVQQRRRRGQRSLTNIVRIISPEWLTWLRKGPSASSRTILGEGSNKKLSSTDTSKKERETDAPSRREGISMGKEVALR
jgi:hypothetical protein